MNQEQQEEGYSEDEILNVDELINRVNRAEGDNAKLTQMVNSMGGERRDENFLHHQISTDEILEKLEHFYKGDYTGYDEDGNKIWKKQEDPEMRTFNNFGVTGMMEILTRYIDRGTILSNYSEQRIYEIISDIGDDLILFMECNYLKMGMDTYYKKTKFRLIITTTTHIIENTYRRAINAETLTDLNQSRVVGQFGSPGNMSSQPGRTKKENFFHRLFS